MSYDQDYSGEVYFEARLPYDPRRDVVWKEVVRDLKEYIPEDGSVLDLGAGHCHLINNVQARKRYALDLAPVVVRCAGEGVEAHVGPAEDLSFLKDHSIDVVFASNFFEHIPDDLAVQIFAELQRILKPEGKLIIVQPNFRFSYREYFDDYTHVRIYTDKTLQGRLESLNWNVERITPQYLPYSMAQTGSIPIPAWIVRLYLWSPIKPLGKQMLVIASPNS